MENQNTDALAEVGVINSLRDLLAGRRDGGNGPVVDLGTYDTRVAEVVARAYHIHYEHRGAQRRAVLVGEWEVDPAAVIGKQGTGVAA